MADHVSDQRTAGDGDGVDGFIDSTTATASSSVSQVSLSSVPSLLDSRTLSSTAENSLDDDQAPPRYLTRENGATASSLTFNEAFAQLRKTSSYVAPPPEARAQDAVMTIYVNKRQRGNPMLKDVRNVRLEYRDGLVPDFVIGDTSCCVLFLSTKYHLLHNNYLEERVQSVRKDDPTRYRTKIVLCLVDVDDNEFALREINRVALLSDFFLVLAWSSLEAARYLETLKAYENKPATVIKEKVEVEFLPEVNDALTTIPTVNKTDVFTLLSTFGTVSGAMKASMEELSLCPGVGATKVRELLGAFQEPFIKH